MSKHMYNMLQTVKSSGIDVKEARRFQKYHFRNYFVFLHSFLHRIFNIYI